LNNFSKRTLSGLIFVMLIVSSILISPVSFIIVFGAVVYLASYEFFGFKKKVFNKRDRVFFSAISVVIFLAGFNIASDDLNFPYVIFLVPFFVLLDFFFLLRDRKKLLPKLSYGITGWLYIAIPFSILNFLAYHFNNNEFSSVFLLSIFILIWTNDTFAYLVGNYFGKHSLFYQISPKKTVEGFWGGLVFSVLAGWIISLYSPFLNASMWLIIGLIVSLTGNLGDLTESAFKRNVDIKDSGKIIPGHGGVLDRFDAAIFVFPSVYFVLLLMNNISLF